MGEIFTSRLRSPDRLVPSLGDLTFGRLTDPIFNTVDRP